MTVSPTAVRAPQKHEHGQREQHLGERNQKSVRAKRTERRAQARRRRCWDAEDAAPCRGVTARGNCREKRVGGGAAGRRAATALHDELRLRTLPPAFAFQALWLAGLALGGVEMLPDTHL